MDRNPKPRENDKLMEVVMRFETRGWVCMLVLELRT